MGLLVRRVGHLADHVPVAVESATKTTSIPSRSRSNCSPWVTQTVLAAQGSAPQLAAACARLRLFADSQAQLEDTRRQPDVASAAAVRALSAGTGGGGPVVAAFVQLAGQALDAIAAGSPRTAGAVAALAARGDATLDALDRATSAFDRAASSQAESTTRELGDIVGAISAWRARPRWSRSTRR